MRLRIVSDGRPAGTRIENADTGEPIDGVTVARWTCRGGEVPEITLTMYCPDVDLIGDCVAVARDVVEQANVTEKRGRQ